MEPSQTKTICLAFESEAHYEQCLAHLEQYRQYLWAVWEQHPELLPTGWEQGFSFHGHYRSAKAGVSILRIKLNSNGQVYQVRPSFLLPYQIARTAEVEKALYLRQWGVPFDALAYVFGKDAMYWYRAWLSLGRPSLLGTTIKDKEKLPEDVVADEKHTRQCGERVYVATTAGGGCLLGAAVTTAASTEALQKGYGEFAAEARALSPEYEPRSVCTDGWPATQQAWRQLFPRIVVIACFLPAVLKIKDRYRRGKHQLHTLLDKAWRVYAAPTKAAFAQRLRRLREWAQAALEAGAVREAVLSLCRQGPSFAQAYHCPGAARTSNQVDRLMDYQDRLLYGMRYLHGTPGSARLAVRAMALLWNFHPYGARLRRGDPQRRSPFADLNGFQYHDNWLHNLLIASSLGGTQP